MTLPPQNQRASRFAAASLIFTLPILTPLAASAFQPAGAPLRMDTNISEAQVVQAQQAWCKGLL